MSLTPSSNENTGKTANPVFDDFYNESFPSLEADMEKADNQNQGKPYPC